MPREFSISDKALLEKMPEPLENPPAYFKGLLYGDGGTCKTVTSCSLGKTLLLAVDPGWKSVKNHPFIAQNTTVIPFQGFRQFETLALALYHQIPPYDIYDTFAVDTIANIQDAYVDDILRAGKFTRGAKDSRPQFEAQDRALARELQLTQLPGQDDFHAAKNILRGPVTTLNLAPVNVLYIAHEREPNTNFQRNPEGYYRMIRPDVTESLYKIIFRTADVVGRMTRTAKGERIIDFRGTELQAGKSRLTNLDGKKITAESFPAHIKKWQGPEFAKWEIPNFATRDEIENSTIS